MKQKSYEVRVVAGELKGRMLKYPAEPGLRPTMQRTKASVFDAIGGTLRGAVFIDLYAGAGAMGIEALSRGASFAHFVEDSSLALRFLSANLDLCNLNRYAVHNENVMIFLQGHRAGPREVVYADPPYAEDVGLLLELYDAIDYPLPELLVVEHRSQLDLPQLARLALLKSKIFGQTMVSFFVEK